MALPLTDDEVIGRITDLSDESILRDLERASDEFSLQNILDSQAPEPEPSRREQLIDEAAEGQREIRGTSLGNLFTRMGLGMQSGVGELTKAAGGLIRGAPAWASPIAGITDAIAGPDWRKRLGTDIMDAGRARSEEYRKLAEHEYGPNIGGTAGDIVAPLAATAVSSAPAIPAAIAGGLPAAALVAGAQSFGGTFADALQYYQSQLKNAPSADDRQAVYAYNEGKVLYPNASPDANALPVALASGLTTAIVTAGFGNTGIEAIRGGLTRGTISSILKNIAKQGNLEGLEELFDQAGQAVIQKLTYRPNMTLKDAIKEVFFSYGAGAFMGSGVTATAETASGVARVIEEGMAPRRWEPNVTTASDQAQRNLDRLTEEAKSDPLPEPTTTTVVEPASPAVEVAVKATGWTHDTTPQAGAIKGLEQLQQQEPELAAQILAAQPKQLAFSDERPDSPTYTTTIYLPANSTSEQIVTAIAIKTEEVIQGDQAHAKAKEEEKETVLREKIVLPPRPRLPKVVQVPSLAADAFKPGDFMTVGGGIEGNVVVVEPDSIVIETSDGQRVRVVADSIIPVTKGGPELAPPTLPDQPAPPSFAETVTPPGQRGRTFRPSGPVKQMRKRIAKPKAVPAPAAPVQTTGFTAEDEAAEQAEYAASQEPEAVTPAPVADPMAALMERIAKKEAAAPAVEPAPAPVAKPAKYKLEAEPEKPKTEADVEPAPDHVLVEAGIKPSDPTVNDTVRRQAAIGYVMAQGKWQKATPEVVNGVDATVRDTNRKRLHNIALVREYVDRNGFKLNQDLPPSMYRDLGIDTTAPTPEQYIRQTEQQIRTANAYVDGIKRQLRRTKRGLISGTKLEKRALDYIKDAASRGNTNMGADPVLAAYGAIAGLAWLERKTVDFAAWSVEMVTQLGEWVTPHLEMLYQRALELQANPDQLDATLRLVKVKQAGLLTAQNPQVHAAVAHIKAAIAQRNIKGQKPILTGEALDRQRAFDQVAAHPFIRRFFIEPVERMMAGMAALDGAFTTYRDIKVDPEAGPVEHSGAAGVAVNQLDAFYAGLAAFRNRYQAKLDRLKAQAETANEARAETQGQSDVLDQLLEDFIEFGRESAMQQKSGAVIRAFRRALGQRGGIRNVLGFIAANVDLTAVRTGTDGSPAAVMKLIEDAAAPHITPDRTIEQVLGATREVIANVAQYISNSEPLRARLMEGKQMLDEKVLAQPLSEFKRKMAEAIRAGNFDQALRLYTTGVGKTATERDATKRLAVFFKAAERRILTNILALQQVAGYVETVEKSPEWRSLSTEAYRDLGVREVTRGLEGTTLVLDPVFDEEPTRLSLDPSGMVARANLDTLKAYRDRALVYLSDPTASGYDPRKAAAMQGFLDDQDNLLNPAINPEAGKFVEGWMRRSFRSIFGFLGRIDLIPQHALDRTAGMISDMAHRTLNAYQTIQELKTGILRAHHQKLRDTLDRAMRSHKMEGDVDGYRDRVWAPLSASLQHFENTRQLRAGTPIGNGVTITREDMEYFTQLRAFERDVMNAAAGVGDRAFSSIRQNPGGILYKIDGKTYIRMPFETGPGTVHRRLSGRMARWAEDWFNAKTSEARIDILKNNIDRLLFGYINDVDNPKFNFAYKFGQAIRAIAIQGRGGNPVGSFEDLISRILDQTYEGDSDEEASMAYDAISEQVLSEIGQMFKTYRRFNPVKKENEKTIVDMFGGEDNFNTARGSQIVPGLWYDYGSVGLSERLGYLHNSTVKFAIEHYNAVEALDGVMKNVVRKFKERSLVESGVAKASRKAQAEGEEFYNWGEAERLSRDVTAYMNKLNAALRYQVQIPEVGTELDPATQASVGISFVVSSLLTSASANIMNTFGGGLNIVLFNQAVNNQSALAALLRGGLNGIGRVVREASALIAHEGNPLGRALLRALPEGIVNYIRATHEINSISRDIGVSLNVDLVNTILSEWRWRASGGIEANAPDSAIAAKVMKPLETMVRIATEALKQGTVGFVDSRLNSTGMRIAVDLEQDLMQRAIRYGRMREQRAMEGGWNPDDVTDLRNRFSAKELVGGRLPDASAQRLRDLLRRHADLNVDAAMLRFYRRWVDAGSPDPENLPDEMYMLDRAQAHQMALSISSDINQATFANRPIAVRSGKGAANLGLFLGYPAFEMYKLASLTDRLSGQGMRGIENLPQIIGMAVTMVVIGSLAVGLSEEARRLLLKRQSPFPTIFNFNQTPKSYALTLINGAASMFPFYGAMINATIGRTYKTGFDLNSQIMLLNLGTDMFRLTKEFYQSGQYLRPLIRFAGRWTFPVNWLAPHLPIMKGLTEVSQVRNSLSSSARQIGMEHQLKPIFSATEVTYSASTGPVNEFINAVGQKDMPGAMDAFRQLVEVKQKEGNADPVQSAIRSLEARNPVTQVFGAKPTPEEWTKLTSVMRPSDAQRVNETLSFYDQAIQAVGARPAQFIQTPRVARSGGGGGTGSGTGGTSAGSVPEAVTIGAPPAPSLRLSSGGGIGIIGPARALRIRVPRIGRGRTTRLRTRTARAKKVGGKLRSRLRIRRR